MVAMDVAELLRRNDNDNKYGEDSCYKECQRNLIKRNESIESHTAD